MGTIAATNNTTLSTQSLLLQSRIEAARREADQAESRARDLRAQADDEQRKADQGHDEAHQLTAQQTQVGTTKQPADPTYASAVRAPAAEPPAHVENPRSLQTVVIAKSVSSLMAQAFTAAGDFGQRPGRLLSVTA